MELELTEIKDKMIMCRFEPAVFVTIGHLARKHKTSKGKIVRALVVEALKLSPTK